MNHKVIFRSVFVVAVALVIASVSVRAPKDAPVVHRTAQEKAAHDSTARAMASYRVSEEGLVGGIDYRGAGYTARVAESGFRFGSGDFTIEMGAPRVEQGD